MADYQESYLSFSIVIHVRAIIHNPGSFCCQEVNIDSPKGKRIMSMIYSEIFESEVDAEVFGKYWARAWIDKNTAASKT